ncbi:MAG: twin-arginine translocase subunit TatC, partial [Planctomycetaceae bacterium]|nr:twin-arginine translocase subunit TatC [Planctomycetaceae bacterium]
LSPKHPQHSTMKDDNLFAETSMSFGEHLEELRKCFFNSLYWIVAGTVIGFCVGNSIVDYIQVPVKRSLEKYHMQQSRDWLETESKKLESEGYSQEIISVLEKYKITPTVMYVFPGEFERVRQRQTSQHSGIANPVFDLNEIDNLTARKNTLKRKQEEILGSVYDSVHLNEQPIRMLFFTKIANDPKTRTKSLGVYEAFSMYLKASLVFGLVLSSPFVAGNLWSFIAAGLYPHEKKYVYYFIPVSVGLFIGGALFAFFFVFQFVLDFLFGFNARMNIDPDPRISEWVGFALMLPIGFGASFQLPLVMFVLERVGIFTFKQYISSWRISILAIFVLALLLTPGDPGSMLLMAVPLTILYFGGVFFCWLIPRKKGLFDPDEEESA